MSDASTSQSPAHDEPAMPLMGSGSETLIRAFLVYASPSQCPRPAEPAREMEPERWGCKVCRRIEHSRHRTREILVEVRANPEGMVRTTLADLWNDPATRERCGRQTTTAFQREESRKSGDAIIRRGNGLERSAAAGDGRVSLQEKLQLAT